MRGEDWGRPTCWMLGGGSPPHARGRRRLSRSRKPHWRITPACAGKTGDARHVGCLGEDHPRMRGEDADSHVVESRIGGSPPHARGRLCVHTLFDGFLGGLVGSPPHARGRRKYPIVSHLSARITPACAGKTNGNTGQTRTCWDHPRMRGEDIVLADSKATKTGSPPHARGRHKPLQRPRNSLRITPACAGKTCSSACVLLRRWDHPRMRGEDASRPAEMPPVDGSPPHARGRLGHYGFDIRQCRDHPRMRGEDEAQRRRKRDPSGSPPHARGRQLDSPGNPAKSSSSLPVFLHSQPNPLKRFLRRVLGL